MFNEQTSYLQVDYSSFNRSWNFSIGTFYFWN